MQGPQEKPLLHGGQAMPLQNPRQIFIFYQLTKKDFHAVSIAEASYMPMKRTLMMKIIDIQMKTRTAQEANMITKCRQTRLLAVTRLLVEGRLVHAHVVDTRPRLLIFVRFQIPTVEEPFLQLGCGSGIAERM